MLHGREPSGDAGKGCGPSANVTAIADVAGASQVTLGVDPGGTLDSGDPAVHCALTIPRGYEPGYAYPLIVWFHEAAADERQLVDVLPFISDQNYAGLAVRGPLPVLNGLPGQRRWSLADRFLHLLEDELAVGLQHAAEHINVNWDRVVVAGLGQGATVALRMLLRRPEWFAGAACVGAEWVPGTRLEAWGQYRHKPLWLGHIRGWSPVWSRAAVRQARLLRTAGFNVVTHVTDFDDADPANLGLIIDRWLMSSLCPDTVVM